MKSSQLAMLILASATLVVQSAKAQSPRNEVESVNKSPVAAPFASGGQVNVHVCPGSIKVNGTDANVVRVTYDKARYPDHDIKVRLETVPGDAILRITGCPHNNFELTIEMPKSSSLFLRMFAGELNIAGITGSKDVEVHAGDVTIDVGAAADYRHVDASVLTGDLEASAFNVSKSGLFRSFSRDGDGKFKLHAHVGAGDLNLR
jgi:hypothetical protein